MCSELVQTCVTLTLCCVDILLWLCVCRSCNKKLLTYLLTYSRLDLVPTVNRSLSMISVESTSPVIFKVFEHCILDQVIYSDNQFGFKKQSGCAQAIYVFRCVIDHYVNSGSTVNVWAIDVSKPSKVFDKMNHFVRRLVCHWYDVC